MSKENKKVKCHFNTKKGKLYVEIDLEMAKKIVRLQRMFEADKVSKK